MADTTNPSNPPGATPTVGSTAPAAQAISETPAASPASGSRVIFADFAVTRFSTIMESLRKDGMTVDTATEVPGFLEFIKDRHYDICVLNLIFDGVGPFELIASVRRSSKNPDLRIVVISKQVHRMNIHNTIKAGANDFVADPFEPNDLYKRILYHLKPKQVLETKQFEGGAPDAACLPFLHALVSAVEKVSQTDRGKDREAFFRVVEEISRLLESNRTSLIVVDFETLTGAVLATSDDATFSNFPIELAKYPEILHVMYTGHFVQIQDTSSSDMTEGLVNQVKSIEIASIMVFPIRFQGEVIGVLTVRRSKVQALPSPEVMRIVQAIADITAAQAHVRSKLRKIYKDYEHKTKANKAASSEKAVSSPGT